LVVDVCILFSILLVADVMEGHIAACCKECMTGAQKETSLIQIFQCPEFFASRDHYPY